MTKEIIGDINLKMLEEFSEAHGISGNEKEVSRVMKKWLQPYADEISYDNLGSIVGIQKGAQDGVKLMIAGHMDEVGFFGKRNRFAGIYSNAAGWWLVGPCVAKSNTCGYDEGRETLSRCCRLQCSSWLSKRVKRKGHCADGFIFGYGGR